MQFTKSQIIFLGIGGVIALILALVATGLLPGIRYKEKVMPLTFWGVDDPRVWVKTIANFREGRPDLSISYKQVEEDKYEAELIEAMTLGKGPDIFMFENNWLLKHGNKIVPAPVGKMTLDNVEKLFPQVIKDDFVANGEAYALPLYIDTLAMVYNRTFFDQGKIVFPPKTWEEVTEAVGALKIMSGDTIERAAFALGGSSGNVTNAADIISAFLLQSGSRMVSDNLSSATFADFSGTEAFDMYTRFANPSSLSYTWNQSMHIDSEALVRGEVAAIFMHEEEARDLEDRNSFLETSVAPFPQINLNNEVNIADYWGLAVSGVIPDLKKISAWDFVIYAT
ncbi:MAG: extracellular solute-binding protein, partial [Candidatus Colwellbacteria bacterium]|nr:extracellular solute-binding protein [Candidatus Colwellbacteria bacterium]